MLWCKLSLRPRARLRLPVLDVERRDTIGMSVRNHGTEETKEQMGTTKGNVELEVIEEDTMSATNVWKQVLPKQESMPWAMREEKIRTS